MAPRPLDRLRQLAMDRPDRLAFSMGSERLTYRQLLAAASRLAAGLRAAGLVPGERLVIALPAGLDLVCAFYAGQLAGAAPCVLSPRAPAATLLRRAGRVRPSLLWVEEERRAELADAAAGTLRSTSTTLLRASSGTAAVLDDAPAPMQAVAHLQLTSGTSGEPRAAAVTHAAVAAYLRSVGLAMPVTPGDRFVTWVPPWHDLGLYNGLLSPVAFGCESHLVEPAISTIGAWLQSIGRVGGTITGAPDFAYRLACRLVDPATVDLSSLHTATSGGEPVRLSTIEAFEQRFGVRHLLRPAYGLAEANLGVSIAPRGRPPRVHRSGAVSCGPPMPGVEVRIGRPDGSAAGAEECGEILVRSPSLFSGYFDAPTETAAALAGGWLHTGDSGFLDGEGELYVLGRRDTLLKRGGAALAPREIEELAERLPGVRASAAVAVGERIVLAMEQAEQHETSAAALAHRAGDEVRNALGFVPELLVLAPRTIPRTENGKVRHAELRLWLERDELPAATVRFAAAGPDPHAG